MQLPWKHDCNEHGYEMRDYVLDKPRKEDSLWVTIGTNMKGRLSSGTAASGSDHIIGVIGRNTSVKKINDK